MEGKGIAVALMLGLSVVAFAVLLGTHVINFGPNQTLTTPQTVVTTTPQGTQTTTTVVSPSSWSIGTSALTVQVSDRDALANSALTEGTNIQTDYWWANNGQVPMNFLGAASTSTPFGATFNMIPAYQGLFYIRTQIVTGQSYYITPLVTKSSNPCIQGYDFLDVQNTGTQQWVFQCNMANSGVPPSSANAAGSGGTSPLMPYYAFAYAYTKPTITYNNGGAINAGTGVNAQTQILYVEKQTTAKAFAVGEIDITVNGTNSTAYLNQGMSNIQLPVEQPNGGMTIQTLYFTGANIAGISDGTNLNWKWYFNAPQDSQFGVAGTQQNNNLKGAYIYFALNNGSPAQIPFTTNVFTSLTVAHDLLITEKHIFITPAQGTDSNSQAVKVCHAANCS